MISISKLIEASQKQDQEKWDDLKNLANKFN